MSLKVALTNFFSLGNGKILIRKSGCHQNNLIQINFINEYPDLIQLFYNKSLWGRMCDHTFLLTSTNPRIKEPNYKSLLIVGLPASGKTSFGKRSIREVESPFFGKTFRAEQIPEDALEKVIEGDVLKGEIDFAIKHQQTSKTMLNDTIQERSSKCSALFSRYFFQGISSLPLNCSVIEELVDKQQTSQLVVLIGGTPELVRKQCKERDGMAPTIDYYTRLHRIHSDNIDFYKGAASVDFSLSNSW